MTTATVVYFAATLAQNAASAPIDALAYETNLGRSRMERRALQRHSQLDRLAQMQADDMAIRSYFDHVSPEGHDLAWRVRKIGLTGWLRLGENLATYTRTPRATVQAWLEAPSHRRQLLDPGYTHCGYGCAVSKGGRDYWVQTFGKFETGANR